MDIQNILEGWGLEEKEAKVYLALLDEGEVTATKLAEKTALDRTLMYQITTKLIEKGLVSYIIKENVRYFSAADPELLLKTLKEKEENLKQILPELKARQKKEKQITKVELYQGRKGVYAVLKKVVSDAPIYYCMGGMHEACTLFEIEAEAVVRLAEKNNVKGKILARKKEILILGRNEELRFVPDSLLSSTSTMIMGNKVAIFVWSEPYFALLIENEEIARGNLATFRYLWNLGERPSAKEIKARRIKD